MPDKFQFIELIISQIYEFFNDISPTAICCYASHNDVAHYVRNDAMFAPMCRQAHIIREANIIRRSQHHLPKANIIQKTHLCR